MSKLKLSKRTKQEIASFCEEQGITEFSLFGSSAEGGFSKKSDVDVLIGFPPGEFCDMRRLIEIQIALEKIFDRDVDVLRKHTLMKHKNPYFKKSVLDSTKVVYAKE